MRRTTAALPLLAVALVAPAAVLAAPPAGTGARLASFAAIGLAAPSGATSAPSVPAADAGSATVVVDFVAQTGEPPWFASAMELAVVEELGRFRRIVLVDKSKVDTSACRLRSPRCLLAAYGAAGVDVVVLGSLERDTLPYEIDETWTRTRAAGGTLDTSERASAKRLQPQLAALARALVETGGVLDRKPRRAGTLVDGASSATEAAETQLPDATAAGAEARDEPRSATAGGVPAAGAAGAVDGPPAGDPEGPGTGATSSDAPATSSTLTRLQKARVALGAARLRLSFAIRACPKPQLVLVVLLLVLVTPALALRLLLGRAKLPKGARPRATTWTAAGTVVVSAMLVALSQPFPLRLPPEIARPLEAAWATLSSWPALVPSAGGLAWGAVLLIVARFVLPPLPGVEHVRHEALWPVLEAYLAVALQRLVLAALALPPLAVAAWVSLSAGAPLEVTALVIVPAVALLGYVWLLLVVDALTVYLDTQLVSSTASDDDPWHHALAKYFRGYARRTGLDVAPRLVDRLLFLPGREDGVVSYGAGWARPRLVVGPELREVALGELAEEVEPRTLEHRLGEWPQGLMVPLPVDRTASDRALRKAERLRVVQARGPAAIAAGRVVGESATLLGWVLPIPSNESVPLVSNNSEDFGVVRELLTEHYAAFEKNVDDEEYDDTDPMQKDFLYGALLVEVGAVLRRDTLLGTLGLALAVASERRRGLGPLVGRGLVGLQRRFGARWTAMLADAYAALNQGRDHLIQYLFFMRSRTLMPLTARAPVPVMVRTSKDILDAVGGETPVGEERQLFRATARNRLVWLSRLFFSPIPEPRERRLRVAAAVALVLAIGAVVAGSVRGAQLYHPVYVERLRSAALGPAATPVPDPAGSQEQR